MSTFLNCARWSRHAAHRHVDQLRSIDEAWEKTKKCGHRRRIRGINNIRLESKKAAGGRMTSVEAVLRFVDATTRADILAIREGKV